MPLFQLRRQNPRPHSLVSLCLSVLRHFAGGVFATKLWQEAVEGRSEVEESSETVEEQEIGDEAENEVQAGEVAPCFHRRGPSD